MTRRVAASGFALLVASAALSWPVLAVEAPVGPAVAPVGASTAAGAVLPPARYVGGVAGDELLTILKASPTFGGLSRDLYGSPIEVRVMQSAEMTSGGKAAGMASAILAGGTLGLLPMVVNRDLAIVYEIRVNGARLVTRTYQRNFTRTANIYSTDTTYGLGDEALGWVKSTATQFATDMANDPGIAALVSEYALYFGGAAEGADPVTAPVPVAPPPGGASALKPAD